MIKANGTDYNRLKGLWVAFLAKLTSPLKISFVVGSYSAFFSLSNCFIPLIGAYTGVPTVLSLGVLGMLVHSALGSFSLAKVAVFHVPGVFAGLSWMKNYRVVQLLVPAVCMTFFIAHPVGGVAWFYTLYWLLPMVIYLCNLQSIFAQALASTLVAHAVGSTIWLYTDPMNPAVWLGLIPVVAYERLLFALGMTVMHVAIGSFYFALRATKNRLAKLRREIAA